MFLLNPDEQRRLLAEGPAATAAPTTASLPAQNHAQSKRKRNHARVKFRKVAALGRQAAGALRN
jgi:hypothetical protein